MTHLNYYDKDHRTILRRTVHLVYLATKNNTKADLETVLLNNTFFATALQDIIKHVQGNKRWEKKLASVLVQIISPLTILRTYDCEKSRELQSYIYDSLRTYFNVTSSEDLPQN